MRLLRHRASGVDVDISLGALPFERNAIRRRNIVRRRARGGQAPHARSRVACGGRASKTSSRGSDQTAPSPPPGDGVVITYPVHPHYGKALPVWRVYEGRAARVVVELPEGYRRIIPVEWTSRRPSVTCPRVGGRLVLFDVKRLATAAQWAAEKLTSAVGGSSSPRAEARAKRGDTDAASRGRRSRRETAPTGAGSPAARGGAAVDRRGGGKGAPRRRRGR